MIHIKKGCTPERKRSVRGAGIFVDASLQHFVEVSVVQEGEEKRKAVREGKKADEEMEVESGL